MKKIILLLSSIIIYTISYSQWVPATVAETTYSTVFTNSNGPRYNVGTDTRSAFASVPHSAAYANYLNVTVSDYQIAADGRAMFWESSHGTNGSENLPYDAQDPDVVLVEGTSPLSVWAIVVYYSENAASPGNPGYYMSCAEFLPTNEFDDFEAPVLIYNYTPTPAYQPCINIDSDNQGNYAVVFQKLGAIESRTATLTGATPPPPANPMTYTGLKRPDVSVSVHSTPDKVKIVALSNNRNRYFVRTRQLPAVDGLVYMSPLLPKLNWPRIASPTTADTRYAITMMQRDTSTGARNILFNTFNGITPSGLLTVNNGTAASYPSDISDWNNAFPAISYHSNSGNELISLAWWGRRVLGSPNLNRSFIGLDINPNTLIPTVPNAYFDISYLTTTRNNRATIGVSGRYTDWCKTTAFAYGLNNTTPTELVWKYVVSPTFSWKQAPGDNGGYIKDKLNENSTMKLYPNPVNDHLNVDLPGNDKGYMYTIYNQQGQALLKKSSHETKLQVPTNSLSRGSYFLQMMNNDTKEVSRFKFLKE